jgi:hypothetical protein
VQCSKPTATSYAECTKMVTQMVGEAPTPGGDAAIRGSRTDQFAPRQFAPRISAVARGGHSVKPDDVNRII